MGMMRAGLFLLTGSVSSFQRLAKQRQNMLWDAIKSGTLSTYLDVLDRDLIRGFKEVVDVKALPIRLHIWGGDQSTTLLYKGKVFLEGETIPATVLTLLQETVPCVLLGQELNKLRPDVSLVWQGITLPLDVPLYWLSIHGPCFDQYSFSS